MSRLSICVAIVGFSVGGQAFGQVVKFSNTTDTIQVSDQTVLGTQATFEAVILFTKDLNGDGSVFNEWTDNAEDKRFFAGPDRLEGYGLLARGAVKVSMTIPLETWHHIVYEYDGTDQRLYVDGQVVGTLPTASGNFNDSSGLGHLGGTPHTGSEAGFLGYLDSFRISDVARYGGSSFTPILGDFTTDANTLLLYNFDDFTDSSGNGLDGTTATGFDGATAPIIVAQPPILIPAVSTWGLMVMVLLLLAAGTLVMTRRKPVAG